MSEALKRGYEIYAEIGRGRYGVVYLCKSLDPLETRHLAVKSIEKGSVSGEDVDSQCLMEPKILFRLSPHPNVIRIYNFYDDPSHLHMILELCDSPDLHQIIAEKGPISESEAAKIFTQLMTAVAHCHRLGVAHRDIKPENILFDSKNELKLADFGSAQLFVESGGLMTGVVGTPYYVAPEVIARRSYTEKVDVWSAGVVLYTMIVKIHPFLDYRVEETFEAVLRDNRTLPGRYVHSVSPEAKDLLRKMLCRDASRRFSAQQVLGHPWFTTAVASTEPTRLITEAMSIH